MLWGVSNRSWTREINEQIEELVALNDKEIEEIRDEMNRDTYDLESRICSIR